METLKRRGSKCTSPQFFVTAPQEDTLKRTRPCRRRLKIAILGKPGVGKSALVVRYLTKRYIGEYSHEESHVTTEVEIDDEKILVEYCDTCKSTDDEIFDHIQWADGFILVFSITDYWSLYEVARLSSFIKRQTSDDTTPVIVLCNQTDKEKQRRISRAEALQFLSDLGKPVFKTSAATSYEGVRIAFEQASRMIYKWKFPEGRSRGRSGSIMDPLREAFTRFHTSNEDVLKVKERSSSIGDVTLPRRRSLTNYDDVDTTMKTVNNNLLAVPTTRRLPSTRFRSQSFT